MCCRLYLFIFLDEIKERTGNFSVDVCQIGWTMYIYVSILLHSSMFYFCIYFIALRAYFFNIMCSFHKDSLTRLKLQSTPMVYNDTILLFLSYHWLHSTTNQARVHPQVKDLWFTISCQSKWWQGRSLTSKFNLIWNAIYGKDLMDSRLWTLNPFCVQD